MESNATDKPVPREITALLSDERLILRVLPDFDAGCSLVDSCTGAQVRAFKQHGAPGADANGETGH
jgi:quinolinate synthase